MFLGVNIDHVATLRNARREAEPSVIDAAQICIKAGADGITAHLREDRRHINDEDIVALRKLDCKLNMEMAATEEMQKIALKVLPHSCCIVPENRNEVTTEGGLDVAGQLEKITNFVNPLVIAGIKVSLFIDADEEQISAAAKTKAQMIELHTGSYSRAFAINNGEEEFLKLKNSAKLGQSLGLTVNAGHGLNYQNVYRMHEIKGLYELNIGHSIISRAVFVGLDTAVKEMKNLVNNL